MKKVLIDINSCVPHFVGGYYAGIGRTTLELIRAISKIKEQKGLPVDIELYCQSRFPLRDKLPQNLKLHQIRLPQRFGIRKFVEFLKLRTLISGCDLLHVPHNTGTYDRLSDTVYTIHDLIVYRYPKMWGLTDKERIFHKKIAEGCRGIITCSEASKQDIIKFWDVDPKKVYVAYWGIDRNQFKPDIDLKRLSELNITSEYFLSTSCNHPRKNTGMLLKAYDEYVKRGGKNQLILLNPSQQDTNPYLHLFNKQKLVIWNNVSDADLIKLYSGAKASVMASLAEGFGLPILESLACGTQVICARNSCLPEVGLDAVDYLDNLEPQTLAIKFLEYDSIGKESTTDREKIERVLSKFTWENTARQFLDFYSEML